MGSNKIQKRTWPSGAHPGNTALLASGGSSVIWSLIVTGQVLSHLEAPTNSAFTPDFTEGETSAHRDHNGVLSCGTGWSYYPQRSTHPVWSLNPQLVAPPHLSQEEDGQCPRAQPRPSPRMLRFPVPGSASHHPHEGGLRNRVTHFQRNRSSQPFPMSHTAVLKQPS